MPNILQRTKSSSHSIILARVYQVEETLASRHRCFKVVSHCTGAHAANFSRCISRHKAEINARKEKKTKEIQKKKEQASSTGNEADEEEREVSPQLDTEMELEEENWTQSSTPALEYEVDKSSDEISKGRDYTQDY